jgi:hypothetical protein
MNRDDIIKMANKAGLFHFYDSEGHCTGITDARLVDEDKARWDDRLVEMLAPFAALVAAEKEREMQDRVDTLYAMYEQACRHRDQLMDAQRTTIAAMRSKK